MNALIHTIDGTGVLLVLRLRQILELAEAVLLGDHGVAD